MLFTKEEIATLKMVLGTLNQAWEETAAKLAEENLTAADKEA